MWIVRLALMQPHTIVVLTFLIFLLGTLGIVRTPTDIFPNSDIHLGHRALPDGNRRQYPTHRIAIILWSAGASAVAPLFDAGRRHANLNQARAAYDQPVANQGKDRWNAGGRRSI